MQTRFEDLLNNYNTLLTESSLSRLYKHIMEHDCAILTAFRGKQINCVNNELNVEANHSFTKAENLERNKELYAVLIGLGCGVTEVDGSYIEGFGTSDASEKKENSFFVVNLKNDPSFIANVIQLGKRYCQDAVLIKEKGTENAYLYGTNNADFPSLDKKINTGIFHGGSESMFMSRIKGRPFHFTEAKHYNLVTRALYFEKTRKRILGNGAK